MRYRSLYSHERLQGWHLHKDSGAAVVLWMGACASAALPDGLLQSGGPRHRME